MQIQSDMTVLSLLLLLSSLASAVPLPSPTSPNIPSESSARSALSALAVAPQGPQTGYSRDLFPHWITISGTCNTRETVLKRDGTGVVVGGDCAATQGTWYSPYGGATWTVASDLNIDHVVPLSNAWKNGASGWTTAQRRAFANDLGNPQLIAVSDNVCLLLFLFSYSLISLFLVFPSSLPFSSFNVFL